MESEPTTSRLPDQQLDHRATRTDLCAGVYLQNYASIRKKTTYYLGTYSRYFTNIYIYVRVRGNSIFLRHPLPPNPKA